MKNQLKINRNIAILWVFGVTFFVNCKGDKLSIDPKAKAVGGQVAEEQGIEKEAQGMANKIN